MKDATHLAVGSDALGAIRLDVEWIPGKEGVEVTIRNPRTLAEYATYRAPHLALVPLAPDANTLHSALRGILGAAKLRRREIWTLYAHTVACRNGFTWAPEKLAGGGAA